MIGDEPMQTLMESPLPNLVYRGKVRDTHDLGDEFLMVATDRISAFDVVMPNGIPDKGAVLSQISAFWFAKTAEIVPNHFVRAGADRPDLSLSTDIQRRSMVVKKAERIEVECIVRGYITGSAWSEYRKTGTIQGNPAVPGLVEGDKFPEPLFTPTTKADVGHDENMSFDEVVDMVGMETAARLRDTSMDVFNRRLHTRAGDRPCGHQDGVWLHRRTAVTHRRVVDPGFQPFLGRAGICARQVSTQLRQAVRPRLPQLRRLGS